MKTPSFAEHTTVAPEKSRAEIERLVRSHGATEFSSGWTGTQCGITFHTHGRRVRFVVSMPQTNDKNIIAHAKSKCRYAWQAPTEEQLKAAAAQEERRRWRCLLLLIKAKLEGVKNGDSIFEQEFLAHIVMENGRTVYENLTSGNGQLALPPIEG